MNKKFILLPLTLSAMALVACGQGGGTSQSSGGLHTSTPASSEPGPESTPSSVAPEYTDIKDIVAGQSYTVKGKVVCVTSGGIIIHDGTGGIYCYSNSLTSYNVGDVVEVSGGVTSYHGALQFSYNNTPAVSAKASTGTFNVPEATPLTTALAEGFKSIENTPSEVKEYSWVSIAGKSSGGFTLLNLAGANVDLEPLNVKDDVTIEAGKAYEVKAYFTGFCTSYNYANIYLTSLTETTIEPESVTVAAEGAATSVRVDETLVLTATVLPAGASQTVTWSVKEGSEAYASVSATGVVTGLAEGEATIVATSAKAGVVGEITLTIAPKAATPVESLTLNATEKNLIITDTFQIEATVLPSDAAQSVTYATDNDEVATVSESGLVTALAAGTANITVTTLGLDASGEAKTATLALTVANLPTPKAATIGELAAKTAKDTTNLYTVSGILDYKKANDSYGNGWLVDPATGDNIMIYGSTTTATAITYADGALKFTNPKDATTTLADVKEGDYITMTAMFDYYSKESKPEILGIVTAHETPAEKMDITASVATDIENGTVAVSAETGKWGDTITITPTPAEGYQLASLSVKHLGYEEAIAADEEGNYSFKATKQNIVSATFEEIPAGNVEKMTLDFTDKSNPMEIPTSIKEDGSVDPFSKDGVTFQVVNSKYNTGGYLMMYKALNDTAKTPCLARIYNTTAIAGKIVKIVAKSSSTAAAGTSYYCAMGTAANGDVVTEGASMKGKSQTLTATASAENGYSFFNISIDGAGNGQLASIEITYEVAE